MIVGLSHGQYAAQRNWATALQTYRTALLTYRRFLEMRAERDPGRTPIASPALPARASQRVAPTAQLEGLTPREREVADLVAHGYSNQQIAEALVLTRGTVANHVAHILAKLGASNRTQVAAWVFDRIAVSAEDGVVRQGLPGVSMAPLPVVSRPALASSGWAAPVVHLRPAEGRDQHRSVG